MTTSSGNGGGGGGSTSSSICGNGIIEEGETCDDNNDIGGDGCSENCQIEICGDGILQLNIGEECDDGNENNNDTCIIDRPVRYMCKDAKCGDGYVCGDFVCLRHVPSLFEECDLGRLNGIPSTTCTNTCERPSGPGGTNPSSCGDGYIDTITGEECEPEIPITQNCQGLGLGTGSLSCNRECKFDVSSCSGGSTSSRQGGTTSPLTSGIPSTYFIKEGRGEFSAGEYVELGLREQDDVKFTLGGIEYTLTITELRETTVVMKIEPTSQEISIEINTIGIIKLGNGAIAIRVDDITGETENDRLALITIVSIEIEDAELGPLLQPVFESYLENEENKLTTTKKLNLTNRQKIILSLIAIMIVIIILIIYVLRKDKRNKKRRYSKSKR
ncbi:MAG: DUF4215 domain-containing protein [Nanoarchaeota archaeon]|nr:DUF4215 domain-containing protein [Nanoarchaeota archaeon]